MWWPVNSRREANNEPGCPVAHDATTDRRLNVSGQQVRGYPLQAVQEWTLERNYGLRSGRLERPGVWDKRVFGRRNAPIMGLAQVYRAA